MKTTIEQLDKLNQELTPRFEQATGALDFPFYHIPAESRMRIQGACGLVSETWRLELEDRGFRDPRLLIRDLENVAYPTQHVILTIEGDSKTIINDASYGQFLDRFGISYTAAMIGESQPYPDERVLMFKDGQQAEVAEWLSIVCELATNTPPSESRDYFAEIWNLDRYRPYQATEFTHDQAERVRTLW